MSNTVVRSGSAVGSEVNNAVSYQSIKLSDLVIEHKDQKVKKQEASEGADGKYRASERFTIADKQGRFEKTEVSNRFLSSLGRKTGVKKDYFQVMPPEEVVSRVVSKDGDSELVVAYDKSQVLGVTRPEDTLVRVDQAMKVIGGFNPSNISYLNGEIKASFDLQRGGGDTAILGENFAKKFMLSVPVDGFEMPSLSPILIRLICTNGMVGEGPAFSSDIKIGRNDAGFTLERALSTYSGDQQFSKIAERLALSKNAFASVAEVTQFVDMLSKHKVDNRIISTVWQLAGRNAMIQSMSLKGINPRHMRKISTELCRYDLLNMVTEVRTHIVDNVVASRVLDAFVSSLISRDPDLEGSVDPSKAAAPVDLFFVSNKAA